MTWRRLNGRRKRRERADLAVKGAGGKRLTYRQRTEPYFKRLARRFVRWRGETGKTKNTIRQTLANTLIAFATMRFTNQG
jgi:hypothetical protein